MMTAMMQEGKDQGSSSFKGQAGKGEITKRIIAERQIDGRLEVNKLPAVSLSKSI